MRNAGTIAVTGAGGFIGGHVVRHLLAKGYRDVRAVDVKPLTGWFQRFPEADNRVLDLRVEANCHAALEGVEVVYNLAADMGGMGFIEHNKALCMLNVLINTNLLVAARAHGVRKYFFASSACVYAADRQRSPTAAPLRESDAYPAMPEDGYGWEKLFSERMCRHFCEDFGLDVAIARFHNVYGPYGTWDGGREKAPAAICRKVIEAKLDGRHDIEIWGDGTQTRSFTYVDDCLVGIDLLTASDFHEPVNLGSSELVTINELVDLVEEIAGVTLVRRYDLGAPKGVRGRNSDNTLIKSLFGWEPATRLRDGLKITYQWIHEQVLRQRQDTAG